MDAGWELWELEMMILFQLFPLYQDGEFRLKEPTKSLKLVGYIAD